ncbi:MAG: DinB family protein [Candidatus Sumerlaeaceae bacterium]|nr:DinB family protein [Candidatus Sumerlaeaceae bacterium]
MEVAEAIIQTLETSPILVTRLVREANPAILKRRPSPAKWSIHEHACHLAAVHPLFFARLDLMLNDPSPVITPYNPDKDDEDGALIKVDLDEAMVRYASDRALLLDLLRKLTPVDWQRSASHPEYSRYTVEIMFRHFAFHDHFHAYRIEELVLMPGWS